MGSVVLYFRPVCPVSAGWCNRILHHNRARVFAVYAWRKPDALPALNWAARQIVAI